MSVNRFLTTALVVFTAIFATPVTADYEQLLKQLEKQTFDYAQEKVYLHLDKPYYSPGDDLWFKAYSVAGPNHTPSPLSHNLYVELIDADARVIARNNIFMKEGLGQGDFDLADSLKGGTYTLRAYTNWMRNFDEDYFFKRNIELVSKYTADKLVVGRTGKSQIQFFPEGGEMVANVPAMVAFETNRKETSGQILDASGAVVATFKSDKEGLGKFGLTPVEGMTYTAQLEGGRESFQLPKVLSTGLVLSVDNLRDSEHVWINVKTADKKPQHEAFLVVHTRGLVSFGSKLQWKGAFARVKVPKANIRAGVVHVTLFNTEWTPVAERLVFKHQDQEQIKVKLTRNKQAYSKREETLLRIKLTDKEGKPMKGFFSLSAIDTKQLSPALLTENIQSSILLTSDLNGWVGNPAQYFAKDGALLEKRLDLLMMTKGWRRFKWRDLLNDKFPELKYPVEQGFNVSGKVTQGKRSSKGVNNAKVKQLGIFNGTPSFAQVQTDANGDFEMNGLYYYEDDGVIRATGKRDKGNVSIRLKERQLSLAKDKVDLPDRFMEWDPALVSAFLEKNEQRKQIAKAYGELAVTDLGEVVIESAAGQKDLLDRKRGLTYNRSQFGFNATELMTNGRTFVNALYLLQGQVPGVSISMGRSGEPSVTMSRAVYGINAQNSVAFFVDDAQVPIQVVSAMPAEMVERVEVIKGNQATAIMGPGTAGGAVFYYTKTKEDWERYYGMLLENGVIVERSNSVLPEGYYRSRQFYKTNYDASNRNQAKPDFRELIHWEPMIETDEQGEAVIRYFNADLTTTVQVNVEGIWNGGVPLIATTSYQVKK